MQKSVRDPVVCGFILYPSFSNKTYKARIDIFAMSGVTTDTVLSHWSVKQDTVWIETNLIYTGEPVIRDNKMRFENGYFKELR